MLAHTSTSKNWGNLNKIRGWYQCQYPGGDITLGFSKVLPLGETGQGAHRLSLCYFLTAARESPIISAKTFKFLKKSLN